MNSFTKHSAAPKTLFNKLKQIIFDEHFSWGFLHNSAYGLDDSHQLLNDNKLYGFSFFHLIMVDGNKYLSPYSSTFEAFVMATLDNVGIEFSYIDRIRLGCITAKETQIINQPHVDLYKPHKVALLYFNTCDGDTYLYKEKYDPNKSLSGFDQYTSINKFNVLERSTPEENKLFVFDGLQYHSSSSPTNDSRRIVMNINFI